MELRELHKRKGSNLLFFGKISRMKGLELLIRAMKMLPEYKLEIVGSFVDKNHEKQIRKMLVNAENISARFGWVSDEERWEHFRKADLAVFPYLKAQNQSGALIDAISVGIPVIVTPSGGLHEVVEIFKCGEVVEKNPKAIAEGIKKTLKNYEIYRKGLVAYRKEANWKAVAEKHSELYKKLRKI